MIVDQAPQLPNAARIVRILHAAVFGGLVVIGLTFALVLRLALQAPLVPAAWIGVVLAVLALAVLAVAVSALRPRIPERRADQSADLYWSDARNRGLAIVLWVVVEGAGVLAAVGYFLTGSLVAAGALAVVLGAMILLGPARLSGE
jgi:hypothetical protein